MQNRSRDTTREPHRILLVDYVGELFSSDQKAENSQLVLPIGLMYLAAYLSSKLDGIDVKLVKSYVDFRDDSGLIDIAQKLQPDVVGIRGLSMDLPRLMDFAARLRDGYRKEGHIVVLGGPVSNADTEAVYSSGLFDYVVVNEGEHAFYEIVKAHMQGNEVPGGIRGIVYSLDNYVGDLIEDLDSLPYPDYDLIDFDKYDHFLNYAYNRRRQGVLLTSRGCPFRCTYCHNIMGRTARLRSPENVFAEIEHLHRRYDIVDFFIVDDIFNIRYDRAMTVFDLIIDSGMELNLYFPNGIRGDIIDEPYVDRMVEAGTKYVCFAVETASERLQRMLKKRVKLERLRELINYTCDQGIIVNGFFMLGLPSETEEEAMMTLHYAEDLDRLHFPYFFFARYYHGSEMYDQALELGFTDDMIQASINQLYHDVDGYHTPTMSKELVQYLKNYYLYRILFNPRRIAHMLEVERKLHTEQETLEMIHAMYDSQARSLEEFKGYADMLSQSSFARRFSQPWSRFAAASSSRDRASV